VPEKREEERRKQTRSRGEIALAPSRAFLLDKRRCPDTAQSGSLLVHGRLLKPDLCHAGTATKGGRWPVAWDAFKLDTRAFHDLGC